VQHDAAATRAGRQLFSPDDPSSQRRQHVNGPQRTTHIGWQQLPSLAAVDRLPNDAFITDGVPHFSIEKLHAMQRRIFRMPMIRGICWHCERSNCGKRYKIESHGIVSSGIDASKE